MNKIHTGRVQKSTEVLQRHFRKKLLTSPATRSLSLSNWGGGGAKESNKSNRTGVWFANSSDISRHDSSYPSLTHQCMQILSMFARFLGFTLSIDLIKGEAAENKYNVQYKFCG